MLLLRCVIIPFGTYDHLTAVVEVYLSYVVVPGGLQQNLLRLPSHQYLCTECQICYCIT